MLSLNCRTDFRQKMRLELAQQQLLMVRCLVVYLRGARHCVPIDPEVSTRRAKATGYEYVEVEIAESTNGASFAGIATVLGEFPVELAGIVLFPGSDKLIAGS